MSFALFQHTKLWTAAAVLCTAAAAQAQAVNTQGGPGQPSTKPAMTQFEQNAFKRCEVFKTDIERNACAARVRAPVASGSVAGGGVLREHVITVPVTPR